MRFSSLIWKNLTRRWFRSGLTLLALTTAIAAVVALLGISQGFTRSFADIYAAHAIDIVVSRQGSADRLSSAVDDDYVDGIAALPKVDRAAGVLLETLSIEDAGIYGVPTMGIPEDSWLLADYAVKRAPASNDSSQTDRSIDQVDAPAMAESPVFPTLMLGVHLAERLQVKAGGEVRIFDEPYRVSGVFESPSTWENGSMIFPLADLQALTDRAGQVTYINVVLKPDVSGQEINQVLQSIEGLDAKLLPLATAEFVQTDTRMQIAKAMAWMTSVIALVIGTIGTLNTMLMSVMERTREIGILRAIGWPRRRVVAMIVLESCGLTIVAAALGSILAMVMTWVLSQAPAAKGLLEPNIDAGVLVQGIALGIGIGVLGALLPAWRASQLLPTEAFREN